MRGVNPLGDEVVNSEGGRRERMTDKASSVGSREIFRLRRTTFFGNMDVNETAERFEATVIRRMLKPSFIRDFILDTNVRESVLDVGRM